MYRFITTHFNPFNSERVKDTFYEWMTTLDPFVKNNMRVYSMLLDDQEPEIAGKVIRGTASLNMMMQKEALINVAIKECPDDVDYLFWIDHDVVFDNPNWLNDATNLLNKGHCAVQLFDLIQYQRPDRQIEAHLPTAFKDPRGNPGAAWGAHTRFLKQINGLYPYGITCSGDGVFFAGVAPEDPRLTYARRWMKPSWYAHSCMSYILNCWDVVDNCWKPATYINGVITHLYHGSLDNKNYAKREDEFVSYNFRPEEQIVILDNGLLSWVSNMRLNTAVQRYFAFRDDDGKEGYQEPIKDQASKPITNLFS